MLILRPQLERVLVQVISEDMAQKRQTFFRFAFGDNEGIICIARREPGTQSFEEDFFAYPSQLEELCNHVLQFAPTHDLWYCPQLLARRRRTKDSVKLCPTAWADLDSCEPGNLAIEPSITIESSPGRWQALWLFDEAVAPLDAEDVSRRIAYAHAADGCDRSGWDLTQLLRVPFTYNHKYGGFGQFPMVKPIKVNDKARYGLDDFRGEYPAVADYEFLDVPMPDEFEDAASVMMRKRADIHPLAFILFSQQPKEDWSKSMWQLETLLLESGLTIEETFSIASEAACNKYDRDARSDTLLWKEILKAQEHVASVSQTVGPTPYFEAREPLLTEEQVELVKADRTIIEEYIEWATSLGDAAPQYHQAGAFTILSTLLAGNVRLPTSFGTVMPNLWFMILADTTLTRKTTSMDIAIDLLSEVDDNAILATDGSMEGMFSSLSQRTSRASIFLRDEVSGFMEGITKKEYLAGMSETLTKLYDGKMQKRVLKRETIEVREPVLIFYCGGIKNRMFELLTSDQVTSGFLPRFIFITAEADITKMKPVGPPTSRTTAERDALIAKLDTLHKHYGATQILKVEGTKTAQKLKYNATMTDDAWHLYNQYETRMLKMGTESQHREIMTPSLDRLCKSGLKAALLIAAARKPTNNIVIEELDILHAFFYVDQWKRHLIEILYNIGKTPYERLADDIVKATLQNPGITRGRIMRMFHLSARSTDDLLTTLEQRGLIKRVKSGKGETLQPAQAEVAK